MQQGIAATHKLKSQCCHQAENTERHDSHSLPGEPRTGIISRLKTQPDMATTHILKSQGQVSSVGLKYSGATTHSLESQEQASSAGLKHSKAWHSLPRKAGTVVSRLKTQKGTAVTHSLKSQGQVLSTCLKHRGTAATHKLESGGQVLSESSKHREAWQPLTS
jgi:hypothetical protein